jgi:hypothetical protein
MKPELERAVDSARVVAAAIAIAISGYTVGAVFAPPSMFSDSGWGFAVWRSMQRGR